MLRDPTLHFAVSGWKNLNLRRSIQNNHFKITLWLLKSRKPTNWRGWTKRNVTRWQSHTLTSLPRSSRQGLVYHAKRENGEWCTLTPLSKICHRFPNWFGCYREIINWTWLNISLLAITIFWRPEAAVVTPFSVKARRHVHWRAKRVSQTQIVKQHMDDNNDTAFISINA